MSNDPVLFWVQIITTIFIAATFVIYYFQLRAMNKASEAQNLLSLIAFLNDSENHQARKHVLSLMINKEYSEWDDKDRAAASKVCSSYDTAGFLLNDKVVKSDSIINNYGPSIIRCYNVLSPFINDLRRNMGNKYWDDFDWLYNQTNNT